MAANLLTTVYPSMRWIAWWRYGRWHLGSEWPDTAQEVVNADGWVFDFVAEDMGEWPWFRMGHPLV